MLLDGDDDPPASILEVDQTAGEGGGIRGLLVSLLTIMDVNHNGVLSREEFTLAAEPLGFDVSDGAWADLRQRFGDQQQDKPASEQADVVDLSLVGALFSNKYDPLLEELLRRLLKGVMVTHRYARQMEGRLRVVEEHLEQTSMRELRERKQRIEKTLRRWRNKTAVIAFDGWKSVVVKGKDILQRTMKHWSNQTYSLIWRRWRDFVRETIEQRESAKRAIARMKNRLLTGCFEMWVEQVKLSIEQRDAVLARAAARLLNRDLAGAFSLWAERSRTHAHARELQRKVIMRLMMGLFADVFYAWAEMVGAEVARQDSLLRATANRLFRACLVQTYQKWRRLTAEAVAARLAREEAAVSLAISFLAPMVSKVFGAWRSWTSERRTRLARAAYAIGPARLLFMCMRTWAANVREAVRQREREHVTNLMQETLPALIAASIEGRLQAQLQESVEEVQSQSAESSKEMDEAMVALKRQVTQLQRELSTLAERRLKERQATVQRVLRSWRNGTLQKAYLKWTQAVEHSKHMVSRAVGHWFKRGNGVGRAWLQWAAVAAYEKHVVGGAKVRPPPSCPADPPPSLPRPPSASWQARPDRERALPRTLSLGAGDRGQPRGPHAPPRRGCLARRRARAGGQAAARRRHRGCPVGAPHALPVLLPVARAAPARPQGGRLAPPRAQGDGVRPRCANLRRLRRARECAPQPAPLAAAACLLDAPEPHAAQGRRLVAARRLGGRAAPRTDLCQCRAADGAPARLHCLGRLAALARDAEGHHR